MSTWRLPHRLSLSTGTTPGSSCIWRPPHRLSLRMEGLLCHHRLTNGSLRLVSTLTLNQTPVLTALTCPHGRVHVCQSQEKIQPACSPSSLIPQSLSPAFYQTTQGPDPSLNFNSLYSFTYYSLTLHIYTPTKASYLQSPLVSPYTHTLNERIHL